MEMINGQYFLIFGFFMLLSWLVGSQLKSRFQKYSKMPLQSGLTGKEVAEKMLRDQGVYDVKVTATRGQLTDHYNPTNKTINLSESVYNSNSVAAAAVAAHECGHAIQHASAYKFLEMRSALVPVISISSKYMQWVLLLGIILVEVFPAILLIGIILFATTTLFSFVTLPVEFDASRRALVWLNSTGLTHGAEHAAAKDALKWAARTYIVGALASLATLFYYIMIFLNRR
ncbi:MAG: zinc metallopeptidase [Bacteroidales bacterium]|jgi:Zn-dependent membrane protease YugP